jgi:pimeloyl-ACP methyl ester carboxylesterase
MLATSVKGTWLEVDGLLIHCFTAGEVGSPVMLLHEISAPTLLICGSADAGVPLPKAQRAHELIEGSELYIMQECRHWPQGEKPEEFNRVVLGFLDRSSSMP